MPNLAEALNVIIGPWLWALVRIVDRCSEVRRSIIAHRVDAFCARLNDGLVAVALVLTVAVGATAVAKAWPELHLLLEPAIDPLTGELEVPY